MQLNLISHLIWNDLRRNRWLLLFWIGLIVVLLGCLWPFLAMPISQLEKIADKPDQTTLREICYAVSALAACSLWAFFLILPGILREQPPSGSTAFWLTRPIGGGNVLASKAVVLGFFLVLLPCAAAGLARMELTDEPWGESLSYILLWMVSCLSQVVFLSRACPIRRLLKKAPKNAAFWPPENHHI